MGTNKYKCKVMFDGSSQPWVRFFYVECISFDDACKILRDHCSKLYASHVTFEIESVVLTTEEWEFIK